MTPGSGSALSSNFSLFLLRNTLYSTTAIYFALCTLFSIFTDVITKDILNISHLPVTLTLAQFGVSSLCGIFVLHVLRIHPSQRVTRENMVRLLPIMFFQATGFLFANYSVASVAVSFMHTVKSCESVFTAVLSFLVLGHVYGPLVYLSLLPMIIGVSLSSLTEFSFNWWGLVAGLVSNICFSGRSVASERLFKTKLYDDVNLYWIICTGAFLFVLPIWLMTDLTVLLDPIAVATGASKASMDPLSTGGDFRRDDSYNHDSHSYSSTVPMEIGLRSLFTLYSRLPFFPRVSSLVAFHLAEVSYSSLAFKLVLCGVLHYTYNMFSFMILSRTSPLTHVVLHAVRRMIVIFFSVFWFGNSVTLTNVLGMALVFFGVFWYSWAKSDYNRKLKPQ